MRTMVAPGTLSSAAAFEELVVTTTASRPRAGSTITSTRACGRIERAQGRTSTGRCLPGARDGVRLGVGLVKAHQLLGLVAHLALHRGRETLERLEGSTSPSFAALDLPFAGNRPVDQERRRRVRCLRVEDERAEPLRKDLRPAGVNEERRVPGREEAHRRRRRAARERRPRQVEELAALLVPKPAQSEALGGGLQVCRPRAPPSWRRLRGGPGRSRLDSGGAGSAPSSGVMLGEPIQSSARA